MGWHLVEQLMGVAALVHGGQLHFLAEVGGLGSGWRRCVVHATQVQLEMQQKLVYAEACSARLRAIGSRTRHCHTWLVLPRRLCCIEKRR